MWSVPTAWPCRPTTRLRLQRESTTSARWRGRSARRVEADSYAHFSRLEKDVGLRSLICKYAATAPVFHRLCRVNTRIVFARLTTMMQSYLTLYIVYILSGNELDNMGRKAPDPLPNREPVNLTPIHIIDPLQPIVSCHDVAEHCDKRKQNLRIQIAL